MSYLEPIPGLLVSEQRFPPIKRPRLPRREHFVQARKAGGLTQHQVAALAGVSVGCYKHVEQGYVIGRATLLACAFVLGLRIEDAR